MFDKRNFSVIRCLDCGSEMPEVPGENDFVRTVSIENGVHTVECRKCVTTGEFEVPLPAAESNPITEDPDMVYDRRCAERIGEVYTQAQELRIQRENQVSLLMSGEPTEDWLAYNEAVETICDAVHMEVYGVERA